MLFTVTDSHYSCFYLNMLFEIILNLLCKSFMFTVQIHEIQIAIHIFVSISNSMIGLSSSKFVWWVSVKSVMVSPGNPRRVCRPEVKSYLMYAVYKWTENNARCQCRTQHECHDVSTVSSHHNSCPSCVSR